MATRRVDVQLRPTPNRSRRLIPTAMPIHSAGSIPATLGDLTALTGLNLGGNQLGGEWNSMRWLRDSRFLVGRYAYYPTVGSIRSRGGACKLSTWLMGTRNVSTVQLRPLPSHT